MVLLGEHLGGSHQCTLMPALDRTEHRRHGHHRLTGAHVTLQEPVHGERPGEVTEDLCEDSSLGSGGSEGQCCEEGCDHRPDRRRVANLRGIHGMTDGPSISLHGAPSQLQDQLQSQQLIEGQAPSGGGGLLEALGSMNAPERTGAVLEVESIEDGRADRVSEVASSAQ